MRKDSTTKKESGSPAKHSTTFLILAMIMTTVTLISNITANRTFDTGLWGLVLTSDTILFSISYIISDIISEVYGYKRMRICLWMTLGLNLGMMLFFQLVNALPVPDGMDYSAYDIVLGSTTRIIIASTLAYFAGNFSDSITISVLKKLCKGKFLWVRTIGSSMIGQLFDSAVFSIVAFAGVLEWGEIFGMIGLAWTVKIIYEAAMTPVTYKVIGWCKKKEGIDTYDYGVNYNPFSGLFAHFKKKS